MTSDLRDQLPAFEAAARRLLATPRPLVLVHARPATCHPDRPVNARGLCRPCYETHWKRGTHTQFSAKRVQRFRADFVAEYRHLRAYGLSRTEIAARLGMTRNAVDAAVRRAVAAGDLEPDRRTA